MANNIEDIEEMQVLLDTIKEDKYPMYPDHFAAANLRPGWERVHKEFMEATEERAIFASDVGIDVGNVQADVPMSISLDYRDDDRLVHPDFNPGIEERYQTLKQEYNFFEANWNPDTSRWTPFPNENAGGAPHTLREWFGNDRHDQSQFLDYDSYEGTGVYRTTNDPLKDQKYMFGNPRDYWMFLDNYEEGVYDESEYYDGAILFEENDYSANWRYNYPLWREGQTQISYEELENRVFGQLNDSVEMSGNLVEEHIPMKDDERAFLR